MNSRIMTLHFAGFTEGQLPILFSAEREADLPVSQTGRLCRVESLTR